MERVKCTDRIKNEKVLKRVKEKRSLIMEIKQRKGNCLRHVMIGEEILTMVL